MSVSLDAALSGLKIAQRALDTASTNIANASTTGYTRKILPQETLLIAGTGVGVKSGAITRSVNASLIADLNKQTSITGAYGIKQKYFDRLQDFYGSSESGRALSSQIGTLADVFTKLSAAPNDQNLLNQIVNTSVQTANKINDFASLLQDMRTQTETDITAAVNDINQALDSIARANIEISKLASTGQSTADLEDQRDLAIKTVSKYIQISTFPTNGMLNVVTQQGQTLADSTAHHLYFQPSAVLPTSFYPGGGMNGVKIDSATGTDITQTGLGGQLGALFEMRDQILPQYSAQLDEFAQKLAERFNNQGLKLFTDLNGNVPASVPDPGSTMSYVGFSSLIKVNDAILADPTLIRNGTTGNTEPQGSNEVIRRIAQFTFGAYQYQQASGTVNINGIGALTSALGLTTNNRVTGNVNISTYSPDISTLPNATFPGDFDLTLGGTTHTITVLASDDATSLIGKINTAFGSTVASINGLGQLAINYSGTITLADNTIGATTMTALGFSFGTTPAPEPSFQVQVGTRNPVTISIAPADTSVELLAKLNAVPGLTATLVAGKLVMTPSDGGDLRVTNIAGTPLTAMGVTVSNVAPAPFRQNNLGPNGNLSTELLANSSLTDYASSIISLQSGDANLNDQLQSQETTYLQTLETRNSNISGVNIDEEMSNLIKIQSAYSAAAKMVSATQKLFDELLAAFR